MTPNPYILCQNLEEDEASKSAIICLRPHFESVPKNTFKRITANRLWMTSIGMANLRMVVLCAQKHAKQNWKNRSQTPNKHYLVGGWTTQLKNMRKSKWVHLPQVSGWKIKIYVKPPPRLVLEPPEIQRIIPSSTLNFHFGIKNWSDKFTKHYDPTCSAISVSTLRLQDGEWDVWIHPKHSTTSEAILLMAGILHQLRLVVYPII